MHPRLIHLPAILFWLSSAVLSPAQPAVIEPPPAEAGQDLFKQVLGYWVVDLDSAKTKAFIAALSENAPQDEGHEKIEEEMSGTTFEFKPGQMIVHEPEMKSSVKITVKSQDLGQRTVVADFQSENDDPVATKLRINDDQITLSAKDNQGRDRSFDLQRIDEEAFKKRVSKENGKEQALADSKPPVIDSSDGYPVATPVPDKQGFVLSPYNQKVIDVRDIPSGTLMMDPYFPSSEKKYFRVP
jgi:hypothetical protein